MGERCNNRVWLDGGHILMRCGWNQKGVAALKTVPGHHYKDGKHHFHRSPFAAKLLSEMCKLWYPEAHLDKNFVELYKKAEKATPEEAKQIDIPRPKAEAWKEGDWVRFKTPKEPDFYTHVSDLPKDIRRFDWDSKTWLVHVSATDKILDLMVKLWPDAIVSKSLMSRANELKKANILATSVNAEGEDTFKMPGGMPHEYQIGGTRFLEIKGSGLIADEPGLGKTLQFLAFLYRNQADRTPALVVCPASVKLNWGKEALKWTGITAVAIFSKHCFTVNGDGTLGEWYCNTKDLHKQPPNIAIINYDLLSNLSDTLGKVDWHSICFDESHYLKEYSSQRTQAAAKLAAGIEHRVLLSATPMPNRPRELHPQLRILDPDKYEYFAPFGLKYCVSNKGYGQWNGAHNLDDLNAEILGTYMVRRRLADVMGDLPDKLVTETMLNVTTDDRAEYDHALSDFFGWLITQGYEKYRRVKGHEALVKLTALRRLSAESKVSSVVRKAKDFVASTGRQLAIFAHHRDVNTKIIDGLSEAGLKVGSILGGITPNKRQQTINNFKAGKYNVLVCSIEAAGTGTDGMQYVCHDAWILERPWTPTTAHQTESRIHRMGQEEKTHITYWDCAGTIDKYMAKVLKNKKQVVDAVIDGDKVETDEAYATQIVAMMVEDNQNSSQQTDVYM